MTKEELSAFTEKLAEIVEKGTEQELREYVNHYYPRLPEEMRQELLFSTLLTAVKQEVAVRDVQEKGLAAAKSLEEAKKAIQRAEKEGDVA